MKIRPILIAAALVITTHLLTHSARARLGETYEQCVQRYGQPIAPPKAGEDFVTFFKNGVAMAIWFQGGFAERMLFIKKSASGGSDRLSDNEINILMTANAGGKAWQKVNALEAGSLNPTWVTEDLQIFASRDIADGSLQIATKAAIARANAATSAGEAKKLSGF